MAKSSESETCPETAMSTSSRSTRSRFPPRLSCCRRRACSTSMRCIACAAAQKSVDNSATSVVHRWSNEERLRVPAPLPVAFDLHAHAAFAHQPFGAVRHRPAAGGLLSLLGLIRLSAIRELSCSWSIKYNTSRDSLRAVPITYATIVGVQCTGAGRRKFFQR